MLYLTGTVINVFKSPDFTDQRTGVVTPGQTRVQLQCTSKMKNGEAKIILVDLTTEKPEIFRQYQGKQILVPVGAYTTQNRAIAFFLPPGGELEVKAVATPPSSSSTTPAGAAASTPAQVAKAV